VKTRLKRRESCAKSEEIAVIARHRRDREPETQHLTTDFSELKQKKTYRGFARINADQEEKAKTFETQRNGGSGGNK